MTRGHAEKVYSAIIMGGECLKLMTRLARPRDERFMKIIEVLGVARFAERLIKKEGAFTDQSLEVFTDMMEERYPKEKEDADEKEKA